MLKLTEIFQKINDQYLKGKIFLYILESNYSFSIKLKKPSGSDFLHQYKLYSDFYHELTACKELKVAYTKIKHQHLGEQTIPSYIYFENEDDFYKALKLTPEETKEHHNYICYIKSLITRYAKLETYIKKHIYKLFKCKDLAKIMLIVDYISTHDVSNMYLRELCLDGINTKFIEQNHSLIIDLLDILKPNTTTENTKDINTFAKRLGFKSKPTMIKFRTLDSSKLLLNKIDIAQAIALDKASFNDLTIADLGYIKRAFIIENEISFLSFPQIKDSIAIFGSGYAATILAEANFLHNLELYYFGDIDTDGFAIANAVAQKFIQANFTTILMHEQILAKFSSFAVLDTNFKKLKLEYLDANASECFKALQEHKYGKQLRLEQEFIPFDYIKSYLHYKFNS